MAENTTKAASSPKAATTTASKAAFQVPKGMQRVSSDVVGFYDPKIAQQDVHFIPREAVLMDGNAEAHKPSMLIFAELVSPCKIVETSKSGNIIDGKPGDMIGIWGKPGMKDMRDCCGEPVFMYPDTVKDTGKPNPMQVFAVHASKRTARIPISEDRREKSKSADTWLDVPKDGPAPF